MQVNGRFLTPDSLIESPLSTVTYTVNNGLFQFLNGSFDPLTYAESWEKFGSVEPDEAAQYFLNVFLNRGIDLSLGGVMLPNNVVGDLKIAAAGYSPAPQSVWSQFHFDATQSYVDADYISFSAPSYVGFTKVGLYQFILNAKCADGQGFSGFVKYKLGFWKQDVIYTVGSALWSSYGASSINMVFASRCGVSDLVQVAYQHNGPSAMNFTQAEVRLTVLYLGNGPE